MTMQSVQDIFNDNERFKKPFDINDIESRDPYYVDKTADWLVGKLGSESSREYYCKVARYIQRPYLDNLVTIAIEKGKHPAKLFNHLAEKRLRQLGVEKK
jgi:hypothetical protein